MDILEFAMQMERDGEEYYRELAQKVDDTGLKNILTMLADDEVKHYQTVKKMKAARPRLVQTKVLSKAKNIFARMKGQGVEADFGGGQVELYKKAQEIEKKSEEFYTSNASKVKEDYQKELFLALAEEEKKHYFLLGNIIEFVSRPQTWVENAEFNHLDEY
jgi:rubrerythrin